MMEWDPFPAPPSSVRPPGDVAPDPAPPDPESVPNKAPFGLAQIYDEEIEALAQDAYQRDYLMFGFDTWG